MAAEYESAIGRDARHGFQAEIGTLRVALVEGHGGERAVRAIGPRVIGTDEAAGVARGFGADLRAAMRAAVMECADAAIGMAHDDDALARHARREEIARVPELAVVAQPQPGAAEQALLLFLEHCRIGIDATVDAAATDQARISLREFL